MAEIENKINIALAKLSNAIDEKKSLKILDTSRELISAILNLLDIKDFDQRIFPHRRVEAESSRFEEAPGLKQPAAYEIVHDSNLPIDIKVYWLKKSTKANISWVVGLTPNYEDDPKINQNKNIGIDFVLDLNKKSLFVVLSKNFKLRVLELNSRLSPTQHEIFSKWKEIGNRTKEKKDQELKEFLHQELWKSFDFEPVNKKFYQELVGYFDSLVNHLKKQGKTDKQAKLFATRLFGRLIFIWFLRKKGFIAKEYDYFTPEKFSSNTEFYKKKLEPLFFSVLNTEIKDRKKQSVEDLKTPFLNGGLFEATEDDFKGENIEFPEKFFESMFSFLNHYNFTVDEGSSEYQQVAIDPEMLGRIFENLLASFIDETGKQARKAQGAFYTPREIVDYMCKESLFIYLENKFVKNNTQRQRLDELFNLPESKFQDQDHNKRRDFRRDLPAKEIVEDLLENVKILDPAVGSGAFPIGMLHLIMKIINRLDPKAEKDEAELKEKILSKSIYGVDIDNMAIQIARLRAWLSILVDMKDLKKVKPLPNLEFKFVCANTLIPLRGENETLVLFDDHNLKDKQIELINKYYSEHRKREKEKLRKEYLKLIGADKGGQATLDQTEYTRKLKSYNPFDPANSTDFYDPELMHGVAKFDIVIGNPPYVSLEKIRDRELKKEFRKYYDVFAPRGDLYTLFYERGAELLKEGGYLTYITSNKWMRADYGKKLRDFFLSKNPLKLLDLGEGVFESATVDTNILILQNAENKNQLEACAFGSDYKKGEDIAEYFETHKVKLDKEGLKNDVWFIGSKEEIAIKKKIEKAGVPLKDWDIEINYGIKTGFNEAFIIDTETKEKLIKEDPKSAEIIKPVLRGRDIGRYYADFAGKWLIATHNGYKDEEGNKIPRIDVNSYPAVKNWLDQFYEKLEKRYDQGDTPYNLRDCAYWPKFEQEKIVWQRITKKPTFYLSKPGEYILDSMAFISDLKGQGKYLLGILNSKLIAYWVKNNVHQYGSTGYRLSNQYVEQIQIPETTPQNKNLAKQIENLVDQILQLKNQDKNADTKHLEAQIDELVFELYGLSDIDRAFIEHEQ